MIGIYKITNKINNKIYIGKSTNIEERFKQHIFSIKNSNDSWYPIARKESNSINDFSFEILQECENKELKELEEYWINYYDSYNTGYNRRNEIKYFNQKIVYFTQSTNKIEEQWTFYAAQKLNGNDFKLFIFLYFKNINNYSYILNNYEFNNQMQLGKNGLSVSLKKLEEQGYLVKDNNDYYFNFKGVY